MASLHHEERFIASACGPSRVPDFDTSAVELKTLAVPPLSSTAAEHELLGAAFQAAAPFLHFQARVSPGGEGTFTFAHVFHVYSISVFL